MKQFLKTLPMLLVFLTVSQAAQTPAISDTPAGNTLRAWLESFNSGDRGQIQAYVAKYEPAKSVDDEMGFRNQTGGFAQYRQERPPVYRIPSQREGRPNQGGGKDAGEGQ